MTARFLTAASGAALLAATPALAELTAQQVWDEYRTSLGVGGQTVTVGSEEQAGGVLTVRDLAFNTTDAQGGTASGTLAEITFTENGDGTVTVTTSEEFPITITTPADPAAGTPASTVALALRQTGLQLVASGDPGAIAYDLSAARYAVELVEATQDGQPVEAQGLFALNDVSGTYANAGSSETLYNIDYDLAAASLELLLDIPNAQDGSRFNLSGQVQDFATQAVMALPLGAQPAGQPMAGIPEGLSLDGGYSYGGANYIFEVTDATGTTSGTASTGAGTLDFALTGDAVSYTSDVDTVALDVSAPQVPFPVSAQIAEYGVNVQTPLTPTDAPQPFAIGLTLGGLTINEEVWQLFDPGALLPRDPATVRLALSGTATVLADLADPAQQQALAGAPPVQLDSISFDELEVSVAGASVTGTGSFTVDNTVPVAPGGIPRAEGSAEFVYTGVNGLLDSLATLGLVPQEQVGGVRMMLGMFGTPTGDDQLTSRIEATADGQVLVNGQRIQ